MSLKIIIDSLAIYTESAPIKGLSVRFSSYIYQLNNLKVFCY